MKMQNLHLHFSCTYKNKESKHFFEKMKKKKKIRYNAMCNVPKTPKMPNIFYESYFRIFIFFSSERKCDVKL